MSQHYPISAALIVVAVLGTFAAAAMKITGSGTDDTARTVVLASFALLLGVIGNLLPKTSPEGDGVSASRWRQAGRVLCFTAATMFIFAAVWSGSHALLPSALMGMAGLLFVSFLFLQPLKRQERDLMKEPTRPAVAVALFLLVGVAGALALIILDHIFGDRVAQMSAVFWVLILGGTSAWFAISQVAKR